MTAWGGESYSYHEGDADVASVIATAFEVMSDGHPELGPGIKFMCDVMATAYLAIHLKHGAHDGISMAGEVELGAVMNGIFAAATVYAEYLNQNADPDQVVGGPLLVEYNNWLADRIGVPRPELP